MKYPPIKTDIIRLRGGLDKMTPTLDLDAGHVRDGVNFECAPFGGYTRVGGYERFSGYSAPSSATYSILEFVQFENEPVVGAIIQGLSTGAGAVVLAVNRENRYLVIAPGTTESFSTNEVVVVYDGAVIGRTRPVSASATITTKQNAQYLGLAANINRNLIAAPPGTGPIRGVFGATFNGTWNLYAWRDNTAPSVCMLYKSTSTGWQSVSFKHEVSFTAGGTTEPAEGTTLTKGAVTAVIRRVVRQSGSWAAGTAAGRFIIDPPSGGSFSAGAATIGGITVTVSGAESAITFATGGTFETTMGSFSGAANSQRVYGCDGVNRGWEFDGTILVPIATGSSPDTPKHVAVHELHLFWAIGSNLVNSALRFPYDYSTTNGAATIATGDDITALEPQPGEQSSGAMAVYCRNQTQILYGTAAGGSNPFRAENLHSKTGAMHYGVQTLDKTYAFDDKGLVSLATAQEFGNFSQASLTRLLQDFVSEKRQRFVCSVVARDKSQYRAFFNDGTALYTTIINGKVVGSMPVRLAHVPTCAWSGELSSGDDAIFFGGADGYVYQMEKGSSFDGQPIDAYMTFNWFHGGSPRQIKSWLLASLELSGEYWSELGVSWTVGYGSNELVQPSGVRAESSFGGVARWDQLGVTWDTLTWDGRVSSPTEIELDSIGENIQFTIRSETAYIYPYTLASIMTHSMARGGVR